MADLQTRLNYANKRVKFAWAKYYESINRDHDDDHRQYQAIRRANTTTEAVPTHIKTMMEDMMKELKKKWECPLCFEFIPDGMVEITNCGHIYCQPCLDAWKKTCRDRGDDHWKCGMCNRKHRWNE